MKCSCFSPAVLCEEHVIRNRFNPFVLREERHKCNSLSPGVIREEHVMCKLCPLVLYVKNATNVIVSRLVLLLHDLMTVRTRVSVHVLYQLSPQHLSHDTMQPTQLKHVNWSASISFTVVCTCWVLALKRPFSAFYF